MRRTIGLLAVLASLAVGAAGAQTDKPNTRLLSWAPEQQAQWYPLIDKIFPSKVVKRGDYVRPLPKSGRTPLDTLSYSHGDKSWTVPSREWLELKLA